MKPPTHIDGALVLEWPGRTLPLEKFAFLMARSPRSFTDWRCVSTRVRPSSIDLVATHPGRLNRTRTMRPLRRQKIGSPLNTEECPPPGSRRRGAPPNKALQLTSFVGRPSASLWRSQLNASTLGCSNARKQCRPSSAHYTRTNHFMRYINQETPYRIATYVKAYSNEAFTGDASGA